MSLFNFVIAVVSIIVALSNPESQFTKMVLAEYGVTIIVMIIILLKNRMKIGLLAGAAIMAVYSVPGILLLIQKEQSIPMESTMGRIVIAVIAILMFCTGVFKIASEEKTV
jgi:hypothetical protein